MHVLLRLRKSSSWKAPSLTLEVRVYSLLANVRDYSQPQVHATYEATIDADEFRRALKNASLPTGILQSSGVLDYDSRLNGPLLATVAARGEVRSAGMTVTGENAQVELRNIGARYSLANGNAEIEGIHAQLLGGALAGTVTMRDLTGSTRSHLSASLHAVSLAELQSELQRTKSVIVGRESNCVARLA